MVETCVCCGAIIPEGKHYCNNCGDGLIKSKKRVKDFGEVFTPEWLVKDMCNLLPAEIWENIESTFLEPSCGNGAFLKEIFVRKLERCKDERDGLKALNSIFGIDIQADNVDESRASLLQMYCEHFPNASDTAILLASGIIAKRIVCGDSLKIMAEWEKQMANKPIQISMFGEEKK